MPEAVLERFENQYLTPKRLYLSKRQGTGSAAFHRPVRSSFNVGSSRAAAHESPLGSREDPKVIGRGNSISLLKMSKGKKLSKKIVKEAVEDEDKRISAGKRWCFTLNNYLEDDLVKMVNAFELFEMKYVVGREVGKKGTPHLQGYVEWETMFRPIEKLKLTDRIWWTKARGTLKHNTNYCSKVPISGSPRRPWAG